MELKFSQRSQIQQSCEQGMKSNVSSQTDLQSLKHYKRTVTAYWLIIDTAREKLDLIIKLLSDHLFTNPMLDQQTKQTTDPHLATVMNHHYQHLNLESFFKR